MPPIEKAVAAIEDAKTHLMALVQESGSQSRWEEVQSFTNAAETLDRVKTQLLGRSTATAAAVAPTRATGVAKVPSVARTAYYYIDEEKCLAKLGRSRNGRGYKHRITRDSFITIMQAILNLRPEISIHKLIEACDRPAHEPRLVLDLLIQQNYVSKAGRGRYRLNNPQITADALWADLPRELTPNL